MGQSPWVHCEQIIPSLQLCASLKLTLPVAQLLDCHSSERGMVVARLDYRFSYSRLQMWAKREAPHTIPPPANMDPSPTGSGKHSGSGSINSHSHPVLFMPLVCSIAFLCLDVTALGHKALIIDWKWCRIDANLQCVACITQFVCHCCSAWLPPVDTHFILQDVREEFYFGLVSASDHTWHRFSQRVSQRPWCTRPHQLALFRLIWGDVICLVSSHLQSFLVCLLWHDLSIVLSTPTPELVLKSRFNLHASCLQEEEVEEFRVSLSWYRFHPVSVWTNKNSIHPASPPPPAPSALHAPCPTLLYLSVHVSLPVLVCD